MIITDVADFLAYFRRVRGRTRAVIERIPADRLEWEPAPGRFTLGDLARHIAATERWMFAENVRGRSSRYPGHGRELADGLSAVHAYVDRLHDESLDIFASLSADDLRSPCPTPGGIELTTWKWLRAMIEHEIHHRGQIYMTLGLLGVDTPPLYGLTERQVFSNSRALEAREESP